MFAGTISKMFGKKQNVGPMRKHLQHEVDLEVDLEDLTPLMDQVCLGCTQRDAQGHHQAAQSKTELFKKTNTA